MQGVNKMVLTQESVGGERHAVNLIVVFAKSVCFIKLHQSLLWPAKAMPTPCQSILWPVKALQMPCQSLLWPVKALQKPCKSLAKALPKPSLACQSLAKALPKPSYLTLRSAVHGLHTCLYCLAV